jgi:hypothetical protein
MSMFDHRKLARAAVAATCVAIGSTGGFLAHAGESAIAGNSPASCREEVWRVFVPQKASSSKSTLLPRYQRRTVLVCDKRSSLNCCSGRRLR